MIMSVSLSQISQKKNYLSTWMLNGCGRENILTAALEVTQITEGLMPAKRKPLTMQEYLDKNQSAKIILKSHCHGVRLEIEEDWHTVVSIVEDNINLAWNMALKALPPGRLTGHNRRSKSIRNGSTINRKI